MPRRHEHSGRGSLSFTNERQSAARNRMVWQGLATGTPSAELLNF